MNSRIYELITPSVNARPILAVIPHSGLWIPDDIKECFNSHHLDTLRNTDWFLDKLYDFLPSIGIFTLKANFSRYVIDVNRRITADLFGDYRKCAVYERNTWGEQIYKKIPAREQLIRRITDYYIPFHSRVQMILEALQNSYGKAFLFDLHSFMGPISNDICLGNAGGKSCPDHIAEDFGKIFSHLGFDTVQNIPFSGGYMVRHYSAHPSVKAIQIELRYTSYLDLKTLDADRFPEIDEKKFLSTKTKLKQFFNSAISRPGSLE